MRHIELLPLQVDEQDDFIKKIKQHSGGGVVVQIHPDTQYNDLDLLFVDVNLHSTGIGLTVWKIPV